MSDEKQTTMHGAGEPMRYYVSEGQMRCLWCHIHLRENADSRFISEEWIGIHHGAWSRETSRYPCYYDDSLFEFPALEFKRNVPPEPSRTVTVSSSKYTEADLKGDR